MIRRNARLRREYLYRKNLEGKERAIYERKKKIKECLAEGKKIPTELKEQEEKLRHEIELDDDQTFEPKDLIDDEYARAADADPKVMITTSRDPSSKLIQFVKELRLVFPNAQRMNRGGHVIKELVDACRTHGVTDLVLVHEHRGQPDGLIISHMPYGPTAYFGLTNVVTRHDVQTKTTVSEAFPHLIFDNFQTRLGERLKTMLKHLFPVPKPDSLRVMTFANNSDFVSFRHHTYKKSGHKDIAIEEVGPRFEMRPFQIKLGTVDMEHAENEWAMHTFMNTARTKNYL